MRKNSVKKKLQAGEISVGTFVFEFKTPGIGRLAAGAGAEFVLFDMEHTGWSIETIRMLIATTRSADIVPLVRVPATEYHFIARVLDIGAMGLMFPMVETEAQAEKIVQSAKYPPIGRRGAAFGVEHDNYSGENITAAMENANREQLLIAQIETAAGLENVDKIAAVEGIDILWIGQFDLTNSLGIPAQFEHEKFIAGKQRVLAACQKHGKVAGYMPLNLDDAAGRIAEGFRALAYGGDLWIYQQALRQGIGALRKQISQAQPHG